MLQLQLWECKHINTPCRPRPLSNKPGLLLSTVFTHSERRDLQGALEALADYWSAQAWEQTTWGCGGNHQKAVDETLLRTHTRLEIAPVPTSWSGAPITHEAPQSQVPQRVPPASQSWVLRGCPLDLHYQKCRSKLWKEATKLTNLMACQNRVKHHLKE